MTRQITPSLHGRTIRCILFDFGETLWTHVDDDIWRPLEQEANQRALFLLREYIELENLPSNSFPQDGAVLRKAVTKKIRELVRQKPGYEPDFAFSVIQALLKLGLPEVSPSLAMDIYEALRIPIDKSRRLFDDVFPTLAELRQRGFLLGVVTNRHYGGQPFLESIRTMGLLEYFEPSCIAISADLGVLKPNPTIFWHALNALNVSPEETAMVGDSLHSDINGAHHLNIFGVWKPKVRLRSKVQAASRAGADNPVDDITLLKHALRLDNKKYQRSGEIKPDMIIEHIGDLLAVFLKAGLQ